ncbi:MAG: hypothetical protein V4459_02545 [Pseudomonadota bacterium]
MFSERLVAVMMMSSLFVADASLGAGVATGAGAVCALARADASNGGVSNVATRSICLEFMIVPSP